VEVCWSFRTFSGGAHGFLEPLGQIMLREFEPKPTRTDSKGRFELFVPLRGYTYQLSASIPLQGNRWTIASLGSVRVDAKHPPKPVTLVWKGTR